MDLRLAVKPDVTGQVVLGIKVTPRQPRIEYRGVGTDGLHRIRVCAPRDEGRANAELIAFLADTFGVPRANIEILTGATAPRKRVRITGIRRE